MAEEETKNDFEVQGLFPTPVYVTQRDSGLDLTEQKEIEDIIRGGFPPGMAVTCTIDSYIFNNPKLKKLKEFCELHVNRIGAQLKAEEKELEFYITQSWINVVKPGKNHPPHYHSNSIISGVFYVSTIEHDNLIFHDPFVDNGPIKINEPLLFALGVSNYQLVLFPSWMKHGVDVNPSTKNRISISFNTFAKGNFGEKETLNELILR
jgi:uncharacterized protein (TIGR02466 family)